jgi:exopolysaccharide production protein ExoQ
MGLALLISRKVHWSVILKRNAWVFIFFFFMLASSMWSDLSEVSLKRWIRTMGDFTMVLLILTEANPLEAMKMAIRRSAYVLLPLSVVLIKYFRGIGVAYTEDGSTSMWIGVTTHKNVLGYVMMVCAICFVGDILAKNRRRVIVDLTFLLIIAWLFAGTADSKTSQTSLSALAIALCALLIGRWSGTRGLMRAFVAAFVISLIVAIYQIFGEGILDASTAGLGRDATLTGRTEIWSVVLNVGPGNILLGRGYGSFWIGHTAEQVWSDLTYHTHFTQSHNGYIDIYLELGLIGLFLLVCVIYSYFATLAQSIRENVEYGAYRFSFMVAILIHNLTESSYGRPTHLLWFTFLLNCMYVPCVARGADEGEPLEVDGKADGGKPA